MDNLIADFNKTFNIDESNEISRKYVQLFSHDKWDNRDLSKSIFALLDSITGYIHLKYKIHDSGHYLYFPIKYAFEGKYRQYGVEDEIISCIYAIRNIDNISDFKNIGNHVHRCYENLEFERHENEVIIEPIGGREVSIGDGIKLECHFVVTDVEYHMKKENGEDFRIENIIMSLRLEIEKLLNFLK